MAASKERQHTLILPVAMGKGRSLGIFSLECLGRLMRSVMGIDLPT